MTCPFCKSEYVDDYYGYLDVNCFNYCPNCGGKTRIIGDKYNG